MSPYAYSHLRSPPKSKSSFYAASNHWRDITPIPLLEADPSKPDPGPALATIAYSDRYLEAMSYLRAVMAKNESSERVLALTEDIIGMNPAHYTVWGFRMRSLRGLWGVGEYEGKDEVVEDDVVDEERESRVREGVERELEWLEGISERNLKNYQICVLAFAHQPAPPNSSTSNPSQASPPIPSLPPPTPKYPLATYSNAYLPPKHRNPFLTHILSFDAKNYHVWTYRQWLCRRYPNILLAPLPPSEDPQQKSSEVLEIEKLIEEDVRNNSAWSHRYFCVFGHTELEILEDPANVISPEPLLRKDLFSTRNGGTRANQDGNLLSVDEEIMQREVAYAKSIIERTPQNPSPWNYLRGVVKRCDIPLEEFREFCEGFVRGSAPPPRDSSSNPATQAFSIAQPESTSEQFPAENLDLDFKSPTVRSSHAISWLADIYSAEGSEEGKTKARACWQALSEKWDPIRKNYWRWRERGMEEGVEGPGL